MDVRSICDRLIQCFGHIKRCFDHSSKPYQVLILSTENWTDGSGKPETSKPDVHNKQILAMTGPLQPTLKAAATYNAASDHFDDAPLAFWERHGRRAVELANLDVGDRVLDVGCGTGASALPAAEAVGPSGRVFGIDIAEAMLERARDKAAARSLENVSFHVVDMTDPEDPDQRYDAVISVFSLFFTADMERQVATLWRSLGRHGRLVITVWGPRAFEPAASIFSEELHRVRPDIPPLVRPWERLTEPMVLGRLISDATGEEPTVETVADRQPLSDPSDCWTIVLGSGYRWEVEQLSPDDQHAVQTRVVQRISDEGIDPIETNAVHAVVQKTL